MPSLQAKILFFFLKFWFKKKIAKTQLRRKKNHFSLEKIFIASLPVARSSKEIERVKVDVVEPHDKRTNKIIIYIHGGGFVYESSAAHIDFINRLAVGTGAPVFSVRYKLAPEHVFPSQINEVERVYFWLLGQGHNATEIFFAGDSAGGNIAIGTALSLRDKKKPLPAGVIAISAPVDGTFSYPSFLTNVPYDFILTPEKMRFFNDCYRGKTPANNPLISPIFADLKGLPKMQLFVSDNELPFDNVVDFSHKLQQAGVDCDLHIGKQLMHGYPLVARFVPEARESIKQMAEFIREGGE